MQSTSPSSSPPMAPGEYERRRDERKLQIRAKLVELGIEPLPSQQPPSKAEGKKRARPVADPVAPSRASGRLDRERKRTGSVDDLLPLIASGVAIWRPLPKGSKLPTKLTPWEPGMERGAFCEMCYRNDDIDAACAMRFPWGSSCYSGDPPTTRVVGVILEAPWINTASSRASTVERSSTCTALCTWPSPFPRQQT